MSHLKGSKEHPTLQYSVEQRLILHRSLATSVKGRFRDCLTTYIHTIATLTNMRGDKSLYGKSYIINVFKIKHLFK